MSHDNVVVKGSLQKPFGVFFVPMLNFLAQKFKEFEVPTTLHYGKSATLTPEECPPEDLKMVTFALKMFFAFQGLNRILITFNIKICLPHPFDFEKGEVGDSL